MHLVTCSLSPNEPGRLGALVENDEQIVDLQAAAAALAHESEALSSMLALIDG